MMIMSLPQLEAILAPVTPTEVPIPTLHTGPAATAIKAWYQRTAGNKKGNVTTGNTPVHTAPSAQSHEGITSELTPKASVHR
jgi:hypothetical protein